MPFPDEMKEYASWIIWRRELRDGKPTKVPYQPRSLHRADVTIRAHWSDYGEALRVLQSGVGQFDGLGFVLSHYSPYSIIDLDDPTQVDPSGQRTIEEQISRAQQVLERFQTYTEVSPSGGGFHIITRSKIPYGRRDGKIEVYSDSRFFTMTGNTYHDLPIEECEYDLHNLWHDLGVRKTNTLTLIAKDRKERWTDEQVFNRASAAHPSFQDLWFGKFQLHYGSQSQADLALVNMISFYSRNKDQIKRMFLMSELGKRPKAKRKGSRGKLGYLDEMIEKSFDDVIPDESFETMMVNLQKQIEAIKVKETEQPTPMLGEGWTLPPGLLGDIARFIYEAAPRPVQEIALAAAIGLMAGICGQAYNAGTAGLNHYVLVLATTGVGKEAAKSGISKLMRRVEEIFPSARAFIGPGDIASGQALVKQMGVNSCFLSILGEFGLTIQQMCAPNASSSQIVLRKVLLDLYMKSGGSEWLEPTIYSDKSNNTQIVHSPSLSILGETTPDSFFPHLDEYIVSQGLLPRFTCIEYTGKRMALNKAHKDAQPAPELIDSVSNLCQIALTYQHNRKNGPIPVKFDPEADSLMDEFELFATDRVNNSETDVSRQLWSRAHLKLMKLAALIAVGVHPFEPIVTLDIVEWSKNMVERDVTNIINRFEQGHTGKDSGELNQLRIIGKMIREYSLRVFDETFRKYGVLEAMHKNHVIQYGYLNRRLASNPMFKADRMGAKFAVMRCLTQLVDSGVLVEMTVQQISQQYKVSGKAYMILDVSKLD